MKKTLLALAVLAAGIGVSFAETQKIDFDGNNASGMYGLSRTVITADPTTANVGTTVPEWSFTDGDVHFEAKLGDGSGAQSGFALIYASGKNQTSQNTQGLLFTGAMVAAYKAAPVFTVSVPGGKVTSVKANFSGQGFYTGPEVPFTADGATKNCTPSGDLSNASVTYVWSNVAGAESVSFSFAAGFYMRYLHYVEVTYVVEGETRADAGLSFSTDAATISGAQKEFTLPTLDNPNDLPITWTSNSPEVATVDNEGNITVVAPGMTRITASTEGNDEYRKASVYYNLTVIGSASSLKEALEIAGSNGAKVYFDCPLTVTFASKATAFVLDPEGNAGMIYNTKNDDSTGASATIYNKGNIIPAGWFAVNEDQRGDITWKGLAPDATETVDVEYPVVTKVSYKEDADKVVVLKNVTFATNTASGNLKAYGTTPDGDRYEFQDTYSVGEEEPGTYDVTCIVRWYNGGAWLIPIAYAVAPLEFPEEFDVKVSSDGITVEQNDDEYFGYVINVSGKSESKTFTVTLEVPEGWDGFVGMTDGEISGIEAEPLRRAPVDKNDPEMWVPIDEVLNGLFPMQKGNVLTFTADGEDYMGWFYLYKGDQVYQKQISLEVNVEYVPLELPETFEVKLSSTGIKVEQSEEMGMYAILLSGECDTETYTVTLVVPEGWDGFVGMTDGEFVGGAEPLRKAPVEDDPEMWAPLDQVISEYHMQKGNVMEFPADGEDHMGMFFLYKGDKVYSQRIELEANVKYNKQSGVEAVETVETGSRFFNLNGVEVVNPQAGIYVKVVDGKATKVTVK